MKHWFKLLHISYVLLARLHSYWSNTISFPVVKLRWDFWFLLFCLVGGLLVIWWFFVCFFLVMRSEIFHGIFAMVLEITVFKHCVSTTHLDIH